MTHAHVAEGAAMRVRAVGLDLHGRSASAVLAGAVQLLAAVLLLGTVLLLFALANQRAAAGAPAGGADARHAGGDHPALAVDPSPAAGGASSPPTPPAQPYVEELTAVLAVLQATESLHPAAASLPAGDAPRSRGPVRPSHPLWFVRREDEGLLLVQLTEDGEGGTGEPGSRGSSPAPALWSASGLGLGIAAGQPSPLEWPALGQATGYALLRQGLGSRLGLLDRSGTVNRVLFDATTQLVLRSPVTGNAVADTALHLAVVSGQLYGVNALDRWLTRPLYLPIGGERVMLPREPFWYPRTGLGVGDPRRPESLPGNLVMGAGT